MDPLDQTSTLDEFAIVISVTIGVALGLVAVTLFVAVGVAMIVKLVLRAFIPSHPVTPTEDID